jgi:hypothetical protein
MNALSQLDIAAPDHVSVITRDGKVTISAMKDGTSVTLTYPIRTSYEFPWKDVPLPPVQQTVPLLVKKEEEKQRPKPVGAPGSTHVRYRGPLPKLSPSKVRDIKLMLKDEKLRAKYTSKTKFYQAIGRCFDVTGCAIGNIARGIAWSHITV